MNVQSILFIDLYVYDMYICIFYYIYAYQRFVLKNVLHTNAPDSDSCMNDIFFSKKKKGLPIHSVLKMLKQNVHTHVVCNFKNVGNTLL
jgi:hypothetical protein